MLYLGTTGQASRCFCWSNTMQTSTNIIVEVGSGLGHDEHCTKCIHPWLVIGENQLLLILPSNPLSLFEACVTVGSAAHTADERKGNILPCNDNKCNTLVEHAHLSGWDLWVFGERSSTSPLQSCLKACYPHQVFQITWLHYTVWNIECATSTGKCTNNFPQVFGWLLLWCLLLIYVHVQVFSSILLCMFASHLAIHGNTAKSKVAADLYMVASASD